MGVTARAARWLGALVFAFCVAACQSAVPPEKPTPAPRGRIAITFDDAPRGDGEFFTGAERTERLIAELAEAGVEGAMIFVLTENIALEAQGADRLRAYTDAGLVLANHSHTHSWLSRTDVADYLADIDTASGLLAGYESTAPFYRFPFLDEGRTSEKRDALRAGLQARGLRNGYVTVDTYDWYMNALAEEAVRKGHAPDMQALGSTYVEILAGNVEFYDRIAQATLGRSPAHVLLLHENDLAALFVGDLVKELRARGWEIVPALEAYDDPIAEVDPDTLFNGQGRVAAMADTEGLFKRSDLIAPDEDEDWLRAEFVRRGLLPAD